jgi:Concanavalin A-like lectin/glucanases superfamily
VPFGFGGRSVNLNNAANASSVAVLITNTCTYDNGYAPTFDAGIANKFSITFWAKMSAAYAQNWVPFISKRGENNMGFKIRRNGSANTECFTLRGTYLSGATDDAGGSVNINTAGVWRHFAAVWDGYSGTRQIYVGGVLDPSLNLTNDFGPFETATDHHLVIGSSENGTVLGPTVTEGLDANVGFNGLLYDVRFYNYPLSTTEIQTVMTPIKISVLPAVPGTMHLSWPAASTIGYVLQTSSDLVTWSNSPLAVNSAGGLNTVTDTAGAGALFYRLYLP